MSNTVRPPAPIPHARWLDPRDLYLPQPWRMSNRLWDKEGT